MSAGAIAIFPASDPTGSPATDPTIGTGAGPAGELEVDVDRDRGSATVLLLMVSAALMAVIVSAIGQVGMVLIHRHEAQSGADAVALAAVVGGEQRAAEVAALNGVDVVSVEIEGLVATVAVDRLGEVRKARASKGP